MERQGCQNQEGQKGKTRYPQGEGLRVFLSGGGLGEGTGNEP